MRRFALVIATLVTTLDCSTAPAPTGSSKKHTNDSDEGPGTSGPNDTTPPNDPAATGPGIVLRGGSVVDPASRKIEQRDVYLCGGAVVDESQGKTCASNVIDVSGKFIIPGLFDMHVHVRGVSLGNGDFVDMTIEEELKQFRIAGVTGVLDGMNDEAKIYPVRDKQRAGTVTGADIFLAGGAFTPTGGHGTEYGLPTSSYHLVDTAASARQTVDTVSAKNPDIIKIMYDHLGLDGAADVKDGQQGALGTAMKKDVMIAIIAEAHAKNIPTEVHTGTWTDVRDAINAGATMIAHLGEPAMPADIPALAASKGVFWVPTLSLYHGMPDVTAHPELLDDPLLAKTVSKAVIDSYRPGKIKPDPYDVQWRNRHSHDFEALAKLAAAGVKMTTGTDAVESGVFPGWSIHREMKLMTTGGMSAWDALAAATVNAGAFLGKNYGIAPGAAANVVVLDANPIEDIWNTTKISAVFHHGVQVADP